MNKLKTRGMIQYDTCLKKSGFELCRSISQSSSKMSSL